MFVHNHRSSAAYHQHLSHFDALIPCSIVIITIINSFCIYRYRRLPYASEQLTHHHAWHAARCRAKIRINPTYRNVMYVVVVTNEFYVVMQCDVVSIYLLFTFLCSTQFRAFQQLICIKCVCTILRCPFTSPLHSSIIQTSGGATLLNFLLHTNACVHWKRASFRLIEFLWHHEPIYAFRGIDRRIRPTHSSIRFE